MKDELELLIEIDRLKTAIRNTVLQMAGGQVISSSDWLEWGNIVLGCDDEEKLD
jgi:hypothetical protein